MGLSFRRRAHHFWAHQEANLLLTSTFALCSLYITFVSVFDRPLLHPLQQINITSSLISSSSLTNSSSSSSSLLKMNSSSPSPSSSSSLPSSSSLSSSISSSPSSSLFSLFFLWTSALCAGRLFHYVRLPPLFGMLLTGIAFANIPSLRIFIRVLPSWDDFLRKTAFVLILLRCGVGLNPQTLRKSFLFCTSLGILSVSAEVIGITLASHFLFNMSLANSVLFGFVLSSTSPAVTVPTMIQLQIQGIGTQNGIPTMALASASIDNIFAISGFTIAYALASATSDQFVATLVQIPVQLFVSLVLGCSTGALLVLLPHPKARSVHFARSLLLCTSSMALYFGLKGINFHVSGPIAVMISCFIAAIRWKSDNPRGTLVESEALRLLWDLLLLPLLFVLIGLLFDLSIFTLALLEEALATIAIALAVRFFGVLAITSFNGQLEWGERLFFASVFLPKATVQAALAPVLFQFALAHGLQPTSAHLALQSCILSILLTAPAGQLLIQLLGNKLLRKEEKGEEQPMAKAEPKKDNGGSSRRIAPSGNGSRDMA